MHESDFDLVRQLNGDGAARDYCNCEASEDGCCCWNSGDSADETSDCTSDQQYRAPYTLWQSRLQRPKASTRNCHTPQNATKTTIKGKKSKKSNTKSVVIKVPTKAWPQSADERQCAMPTAPCDDIEGISYSKCRATSGTFVTVPTGTTPPLNRKRDLVTATDCDSETKKLLSEDDIEKDARERDLLFKRSIAEQPSPSASIKSELTELPLRGWEKMETAVALLGKENQRLSRRIEELESGLTDIPRQGDAVNQQLSAPSMENGLADSKIETVLRGDVEDGDHDLQRPSADILDCYIGCKDSNSVLKNQNIDGIWQHDKAFIQDEMIRKLSNECVKRAAREKELDRSLSEALAEIGQLKLAVEKQNRKLIDKRSELMEEELAAAMTYEGTSNPHYSKTHKEYKSVSTNTEVLSEIGMAQSSIYGKEFLSTHNSVSTNTDDDPDSKVSVLVQSDPELETIGVQTIRAWPPVEINKLEDKLAATMAAHKKEVESLHKQLQKEKAQGESLLAEKRELESRTKTHSMCLKDASRKENNLRIKIAALEQDIAAAQDEITKVEGGAQGLRERFRREKDKVKILEQKMETVRKEADDRSKNLENELEKKNRIFESQQSQMKACMEASTAQQFELVAKLDQEKNKTERLKSLCRKLLKKLSNAASIDPSKQQRAVSQNNCKQHHRKDTESSRHREESQKTDGNVASLSVLDDWTNEIQIADLDSNPEHANRADQYHHAQGEPKTGQGAITRASANVPKSLRKDDILSTMHAKYLKLKAEFLRAQENTGSRKGANSGDNVLKDINKD